MSVIHIQFQLYTENPHGIGCQQRLVRIGRTQLPTFSPKKNRSHKSRPPDASPAKLYATHSERSELISMPQFKAEIEEEEGAAHQRRFVVAKTVSRRRLVSAVLRRFSSAACTHIEISGLTFLLKTHNKGYLAAFCRCVWVPCGVTALRQFMPMLKPNGSRCPESIHTFMRNVCVQIC